MAVGDAARILEDPKDRPARLLIGVIALSALLLGALLGKSQDVYEYVVLAGLIVTAYLFLSRQDVLIGAVVVVAAILIDTYQLVNVPPALQATATILAAAAVLICYVRRSPERPWTRTPSLWIWGLVLILALFEIPSSGNTSDAIRYTIANLASMPLAYMLGTQIGREMSRVKQLLIVLGVFAGLMSIHAIIQAETGTTLFLSPLANTVQLSRDNYVLSGTDKIRAGSFLINPDKLGIYAAMMLPILLGLGVAVKPFWGKISAFAGGALCALALLYSYSTSSLIATAVGTFAAFLLIARGWARLYLPLIVLALALAVGTLYPASVRVFTAHATAPGGISQRIGAWQTGLGAATHHPLTGVGLGYTNYYFNSDPYLSPLQTTVVEDPQNTYIELAAMGGIPLALLYLLALLLAFLRAGKNYLRAHGDDRVLIGAVLVSAIVLSVNSLGTPGWTFPATGILGWMLLGAVASPALLAPSAEPSAGAEGVSVPAMPAVATATIEGEGA